MQLKSRIFIITLIAIAFTGISGCGLTGRSGSTGGGADVVRANGRFYCGRAGRTGSARAYFLTFDEPRFIWRIVVHANPPVRNLDIYVRVEPDNWKRVKQIKKRVDATKPIHIRERGDAVRVIRKTIDSGKIRDIEAFVSPQ